MFRYICLIIPVHPNQPRRDPIFVYFTQECSAPVIIVSALVLPWWANIPGAVTGFMLVMAVMTVMLVTPVMPVIPLMPVIHHHASHGSHASHASHASLMLVMAVTSLMPVMPASS